MKIIINASIIEKGGGKQVAESVLYELNSYDFISFVVVLSEELNKIINQSNFNSNFTFYVLSKHRNKFINFLKIREGLKKIESMHNPDLVFTIFGPSYWRPKSTHITGFADGWCYNPKSIAFNKLTYFKKIKRKFLSFIKNSVLKYSTDFVIVETNDAKKKIIKYLNFKEYEIYVVGNTFSHFFEKKFNFKKTSQTFNLITICTPYPHKNLSIINEVTPILAAKNLDFCFNLTMDKISFEKLFKKNRFVKNLGVLNTVDCPAAYASSDALFLPTLIETFSASYPESMKMKKPILTSDLDFAKDVCNDAALFFDPTDPQNIADTIEEIILNKKLYNSLTKKGIKRLNSMETSESRAKKYIDIFNKLKNK